jgi:hypothetical protein
MAFWVVHSTDFDLSCYEVIIDLFSQVTSDTEIRHYYSRRVNTAPTLENGRQTEL